MSDNSDIELTIVLPTYNEKENVVKVVEEIEQNLKNTRFEIIVVDDDSPDGTWHVAQKFSKDKPFLKVIRRLSKNKSLSASVVDGFASALGKYLICMDCDMQHDASVLPKFLDKFNENNDIVVGTRNDHNGGISDWGMHRKFTSWVATQMANLLLKTQTSDPMSGYFGVKKEFFEQCREKINPKGYKILLEFLFRAKNKKLAEVGFIFKARQFGKSKLNSSIVFDYLRSLYELGIGPYVSLQFLMYALVALSGVIVNQGSFWVLNEFCTFSSNVALMIAIELSIITNFTLNNAWTFKHLKFKGPKRYLFGLAKFNLICVAGAYINYASTFYTSEHFITNIYLANFIGIGLAALWNYLINANITWRKN
jgi:dolichol-phosphate mannosyltransferase